MAVSLPPKPPGPRPSRPRRIRAARAGGKIPAAAPAAAPASDLTTDSSLGHPLPQAPSTQAHPDLPPDGAAVRAFAARGDGVAQAMAKLKANGAARPPLPKAALQDFLDDDDAF